MHDETLQHAKGDGLSVLVVEDEFLIAMDLELMLDEGGHRVIGSVGSVEDALNFLRDGVRPDVAVLDMNLRGQLVIPVAERLRGLGIPFVIASAYRSLDFSGSDVLADAENIGKPVSRRGLLEALRRAVCGQ